MTRIKIYRLCVLSSLFICLGTYTSLALNISDSLWLDRPHFMIQTKSATYFYDKAGGGFSSIIDEAGADWIQFSEVGNDSYPASAAGRFRGLPNFVFRSDDSGAGHPGFDKCLSEKTANNEITTKAKSGKWQWRWLFTEKNAMVTMEKVDEEHAYWFLYEGTPGGKFSPTTSYWGTNTKGYQTNVLDYFKGEKAFEHWQWIYFGENGSNNAFYVVMLEDDKLEDTFSYLGNTEKGVDSEEGMVVFGFGRKEGAIPLMKKTNNTFVIGFYRKKIQSEITHNKFAKFISKLSNKLK